MRLFSVVKGWLRYQRSKRSKRRAFDRFEKLLVESDQLLECRWEERLLCFGDDDGPIPLDSHYFYHGAWAARVLARTRPDKHVDISSQLAIWGTTSAFVPVDYFEFRPRDVPLDGLRTAHADLSCLPFDDESIASLSCMHVVEHIGLGRYGDRIDPDADRKAMSELERVLAPGGLLLFVVPVGRPRVVFDAHRIYDYESVVTGFPDLELREFALVPDRADGGLVVGASPELVKTQNYGCGCFLFQRPAASDRVDGPVPGAA